MHGGLRERARDRLRPRRAAVRAHALLALGCALAAACGGDAPPGATSAQPSGATRGAGASARRPNVLLISLDSTRRDRLGCYGHEPEFAPELSSSPNLDALAARGVRMQDALAPTSWTLPSHVSLFTGEHVQTHAVETDASRIPDELPTLAELLRANGYRTSGFASGPYLEPTFGFARGFDEYRSCYGPELAAATAEQARAQAEWDRRRGASGSSSDAAAYASLIAAQRKVELLSHRDSSSSAVTDAALAAVRASAASGAPWLVFAHYFDPHYDYLPPAPWDKRFDPDYAGSLGGADVLSNRALSVPDPARPQSRKCVCAPRDLAHLLALYDGEIAWTDAEIGRLLDGLRELGLERDTLVIATADHGDEFFEHGGLGHRRNLCAEVLRVPLILAWPGGLPSARVVRERVSNTDVLPTLLELLDLPAAREFGGRSFAGLARGDSGAAERGASARLVGAYPEALQLEPSATRRALVQRCFVQDAFYFGAWKLERERSWPIAHPSASADERRAIASLAQQQRAEERLSWSALEASGAAAESSSGELPAAARAALDAFRAEYTRSEARRQTAASAEKDSALAGRLGALGYAQGLQSDAADAYRLPPPGEKLAAPR